MSKRMIEAIVDKLLHEGNEFDEFMTRTDSAVSSFVEYLSKRGIEASYRYDEDKFHWIIDTYGVGEWIVDSYHYNRPTDTTEIVVERDTSFSKTFRVKVKDRSVINDGGFLHYVEDVHKTGTAKSRIQHGMKDFLNKRMEALSAE
ncbi:MAG: hypothetical protein ACYSUV_02130 [Planctomycetota bacterium]|jgi:hypothetical protein